jgi:hypothetical protein
MKHPRPNQACALIRGLLLITFVSATASAYGQVAPPDEAAPGVMSVLDQASMYPAQSQIAETPKSEQFE